MCPASSPGGSSPGGSHRHEEPKGSHHGDHWGGSPGQLRPLGLTRVPLRDAQHAPSPWPCQWHRCGLTRHRSLLKVAVGSCDDPVLADQGATAEVGSRAGLGREKGRGAEAGQAVKPLKLGTSTGPLGAQPWHLLAMPVFRASAQGRCCTCRDTCQGHEPGTAFCPLTILSL